MGAGLDGQERTRHCDRLLSEAQLTTPRKRRISDKAKVHHVDNVWKSQTGSVCGINVAQIILSGLKWTSFKRNANCKNCRRASRKSGSR